MRVGYVLKKFPRISETFILNEILELERQGVEVTVFSLHWPSDGLFHRDLASLGRPVVYLPPRKSVGLLRHLREHLDLLREGRDGLFREVETLLTSERNDVWPVLVWGMEVAIAARERGIEHLHAHFATVASHVARAAHAVAGIPYSFTCHAKDLYREGVDPAAFRALADPARFVVTVCEANRRHIIDNLGVADEAKVAALYNGVDLERFHPRDRRPDAVPLVLGVGRLVEKKGFRYLIEAAAAMDKAGVDFRCVIVGDGDEREALEQQIGELGTDRVELAGMATQDEVRDLLSRAALIALPCVVGEDGNRDALPTVLLEAQASGVPVVSTPVVGVEEIVDGGRAGVLVPPGDADALRRAIEDLLGDGDRREALSVAGRERAEDQFDLKKNVGKLREWLAAGTARPLSGIA